MKKKISAAKYARKIEEKYWKPIVRARANYVCEICGRSGEHYQLHCHHIQGKPTMALRINLDNGICLCAGCHVFQHVSAHSTSYSGQQEFHQLLENVRSPLILNQLKRLRYVKPLTMVELDEIATEYECILRNYGE